MHATTSNSSGCRVKLIVLGTRAAGKTSLINYLRTGRSELAGTATVGVHFFMHWFRMPDQRIATHLIDTSGFTHLYPSSSQWYPFVHCALLVFDLTSLSSFLSLEERLSVFRSRAREDVGVALVGNKADLPREREVETDVAMQYARSKGLQYFETELRPDIHPVLSVDMRLYRTYNTVIFLYSQFGGLWMDSDKGSVSHRIDVSDNGAECGASVPLRAPRSGPGAYPLRSPALPQSVSQASSLHHILALHNTLKMVVRHTAVLDFYMSSRAVIIKMDSQSANRDLKCKIIVLGDTESGKTSILHYLRKQEFLNYANSTLGIEQFIYHFEVQGVTVEANIWDTCGQERYLSLGKMYYKGAIAALLVYDITDRASFNRVDTFLTAYLAQATNETKAVLIGNKADLSASREVPSSEAESYALSHNLQYFETSAKTGSNINAAFMAIAVFAVQQADQAKPSVHTFQQESAVSIKLSRQTHGEMKRKKKCRC